jgi:hypothetical protein
MSLEATNGADAHVCFLFSRGLKKYMLLGRCNYNKKYLSSFGGGTEKGETLRETIVRECREESMNSILSPKTLSKSLDHPSTKLLFFERPNGKISCSAFVKLDYMFCFEKSRDRMLFGVSTSKTCPELSDLVAVEVEELKQVLTEERRFKRGCMLRPALAETLKVYFQLT